MSDSQHEIAALFVETGGRYFGMPNVDPWDVTRDARKYDGELPVVAHPPCFLWVNLAAVNWKRYQRERPAWYPGGTDGGCFASALASVRRCCGVLEHPAGSWAWNHFDLQRPDRLDSWSWNWNRPNEWTCEVWQSAYGHAARKRTWLLYVGSRPPIHLDWRREPGTHQVGWFDRIKPTLSKKAASATPPSFAAMLLKLAASAAPERQLTKAAAL
jgi:hypothetical protein